MQIQYAPMNISTPKSTVFGYYTPTPQNLYVKDVRCRIHKKNKITKSPIVVLVPGRRTQDVGIIYYILGDYVFFFTFYNQLKKPNFCNLKC